MIKYHYFVSYSHSGGFGCLSLATNKKIVHGDVVNEICNKTIPKATGAKDVVVINYQLLRKEWCLWR